MWLVQSSKGADVDILLLDLRTLESVRKCAADFKSHNLPLHLLVSPKLWFRTITFYNCFWISITDEDSCYGWYWKCCGHTNAQVNNAGVALGTPWYTSEGVGGSAQVQMAVSPISWTLPACHPGCCCSDLYMSPLLRQPFISSALLLTFKNPKGISSLW